MTLTRLLAIALAVVMLAAACGGSDDADLSAGSSSGSADDSGASEVSSGSASEASSSEASTSEASTSEASSSDASSSTASSSESASAAEDVDGEPTRDVVHKYGTTSIAGQPERVVTIGFSEQDPVLALGVVPVAVREWFGGYDHAAWPWAQEALGDGTPTVLDMPFGELAYETIAGLDPDLIVGTHAGLTEEEYELLTAIAPTIVEGPDDPAFGMSWEDQTRLIGQALGTGDEANQIVTVTLASILDAERVNEGFGGATFAWANPTADGTYWVVGQSTPPMQFLQTLGLTYPAEIAEIVGDLDSFEMSAEQIDLLDVDVLIVRADEQVRGLIEADPLWGATAVIQEDRVLWLDAEDPVYGALSFSTILSIDYLVDELTPMIAEIVDRVGSGAGGSARSDEATTAAMEAFAVVYNSDAAWEDKSPFLQNSAALEASNEAYRTAA
ncbi:MAG: ABC transporter substrate-binding protein, partial [Actinomycetota bacterium]